MVVLRSSLFNLAFYAYTLAICLVALPALLLPVEATYAISRVWARGSLFLARLFCGIRMEVRGLENQPKEPAIYACKHQSAWETLAFHLLVPRPCYVLKRELLFLPLFGIFLWKSGSVAINRSAGASAIKQMVRDTKERMETHRNNIIIFPEGTRTSTESTGHPYHPGVAALYNQLAVPVVPVALNSGLSWGRKAFFKYPGLVTIEFLPAIPPGMDRKAFLPKLTETIESHSQKLMAEERARR